MILKFLALTTSLVSESMASALPSDPSVVPVTFSVRRPTLDISTLRRSRLRRRDDGSSSVDLSNFLTSYVAEIQVGTPPQNISTVLDTGSSDLWVMAADNPYCSGSSSASTPGQMDCSSITTFNSGDSSTFEEQSTDFSISYGDGSAATGKFVQDTVQVGSFSISKANFALASEANTSMAVFGIGPIYGESTVASVSQSGEAETTYDNLLVQMKNQGLISGLSFSLWLNQANSGEGGIIFGGLDHTKFNGTLTLLPILKDLSLGSESNMQLEQSRSTTVIMTGLGLYKDADTEMIASGGVPVLLDSGTSLSYLPNEFVEVLGSSIGATWSDPIGMYITTCEHEGGMVFELGGAQFQVPFQQMIFYLSEETTAGTSQNATDENGDPICALGVMSTGNYGSSGSIFILGETFLRGVYVSFDYENWQVGIAQANYGLEVEITSSIDTIGTDGIPSATSAPSYDATSFQSSFSTNEASIFNSDNSIDDDKTYAVDTAASSEATGSEASSSPGSQQTGSSSEGSSSMSGGPSSMGSSSHSSNAAIKISAMSGLLIPLLSIFSCI